jgi:hypothetical protein
VVTVRGLMVSRPGYHDAISVNASRAECFCDFLLAELVKMVVITQLFEKTSSDHPSDKIAGNFARRVQTRKNGVHLRRRRGGILLPEHHVRQEMNSTERICCSISTSEGAQ